MTTIVATVVRTGNAQVTGNVVSNNAIIGNSVQANGNVTGRNLFSGGEISARGNISAANLSLTGSALFVNGVLRAPLSTKTSSSAGTAGQIAWDANYIYVCVATNTWKRAALASF